MGEKRIDGLIDDCRVDVCMDDGLNRCIIAGWRN